MGSSCSPSGIARRLVAAFAVVAALALSGAVCAQAQASAQTSQDFRVNLVAVGYVDGESGRYVPYPYPGTVCIDERGARAQLLASVQWNMGNGGYAEDQGVPVSWSSSDESVAVVDESGSVLALKNGTAVVTCAVEEYGTASGSITVVVQDDSPSVTGLEVVLQDGTGVGGSLLFRTLEEYDARQLAVRATYEDGSTKVAWTAGQLAGLSWSSSDPSVVLVDVGTGLATPVGEGSAVVSVRALGGADGWVAAQVPVTVDTTPPHSDTAPDELLVRVEDEAGSSFAFKVYSLADLEELGTFVYLYSEMDEGRYQTTIAEGALLEDILLDLGVDLGEVEGFLFTQASGSYQYSITASRLLGVASFYYPYFDSGVFDDHDPIQVPPMLTLRSATTRFSVPPRAYLLNNLERFRLCAGLPSPDLWDSGTLAWGVAEMTVVLREG